MNKKYGLIALALMGLIFPFTLAVASAATEPDYGGVPQFRERWVAQDKLVGDPGINRPYTWGPNAPGAPTTLSEPYVESPGGTRRVLYLDKARMEINNPATGFVTTGLAVKELVSGKRQDGNNTFVTLTPSQTQVAGDPVSVNPNSPVYASFQGVVTLGNADANSKPNAVGSVINQFIAKNGTVSTIVPPVSITIGAYQELTGHNIAAPFEAFKNQSGPVTNPANGATIPNQPIYTVDPTSNVFGLAISDPYWVSTKIAGVEQTVLVQLFERRVLTYNPALATNRVEMGNLGQHYYQWRYVESVTPPPPAVGNFAGTWNTNFAQVALNQSGAEVVGTYTRYGESTTTPLRGTVTGNTLNGYWGTSPTNTISFTLAGGGVSFTGNFGGTYQWCGVKAGSGPLPAGCGYSGNWSTNFAQMNLVQNGATITGTYRRYDESVDKAFNGTVAGNGGIPQLNGYYEGVPSQTAVFNINAGGSGFDGRWGTVNQWCGVRSGALPAGCGWSGKWNLGGTGTVANLVQTGAVVTGTYVNVSNGTISGNLLTEAWTLRGSWSINGGTGTFKWAQVGLGTVPQKFQGNWNNTNPWCGYRDGTTAPSPCFLA
jgi:hypothetical protein